MAQRWTTFSLGTHARVSLSPISVIGLAENGPAHVCVRGPLHRQHALIMRHEGTYWIGRHPSHEDLVAVGDRPVSGFHQLCPDDRIVLGDARHERMRLSLRFERLAESRTAVLKADRQDIVVEGGFTDQLVLLDDALHIGRDASAQLQMAQLPCGRLSFERTPAGLVVRVEGGTVLEAGGDDEYDEPSRPLQLPTRLRVDAEPQDRLLRAIQGDPRAQPFFLDLLP